MCMANWSFYDFSKSFCEYKYKADYNATISKN